MSPCNDQLAAQYIWMLAIRTRRCVHHEAFGMDWRSRRSNPEVATDVTKLAILVIL